MNRLPIDPQVLAQLCRKHHIVRLSLFGSVLRGRDRTESDVNLLVEFEPGEAPGLIGLAAIKSEFSSLLGGRRIDLRTAGDLSRHFRDEVIGTAEVKYAAG